MVEKIIEDYRQAYGMNYVFLRYFNAAGAHEEGIIGEDHSPETHLIPLVLQAAKGEIPHITVFGTDYPTRDGTCIRDYIHVTDLADAHMRALDHLMKGGDSFACNLGTGIGISVKEIINAASKITGKKIPVVYGSRRAGDPSELVADPSLAFEKLGWKATYVNIEDTIRTAWKWVSAPHGGHYRNM
jgi:UDP-glucose-4-epimerase GalE